MRPKVVILLMTVAFVVLGLVAFFKGGRGVEQTTAVATPGAQMPPANPKQPPEPPHAPGTPVVVSESVRAALVAKDVDEILDLQSQVDGSNNPQIINALLNKLSNPEAEVRRTAVQVLKEMNDTNAVPGLQKAAEATADPREKVAILDAIDYIKMPSFTANVPPELFTNRQDPNDVDTNAQFNKNFTKGMKDVRRSDGSQQTVPSDTPANQ